MRLRESGCYISWDKRAISIYVLISAATVISISATFRSILSPPLHFGYESYSKFCRALGRHRSSHPARPRNRTAKGCSYRTLQNASDLDLGEQRRGSRSPFKTNYTSGVFSGGDHHYSC